MIKKNQSNTSNTYYHMHTTNKHCKNSLRLKCITFLRHIVWIVMVYLYVCFDNITPFFASHWNLCFNYNFISRLCSVRCYSGAAFHSSSHDVYINWKTFQIYSSEQRSNHGLLNSPHVFKFKSHACTARHEPSTRLYRYL